MAGGEVEDLAVAALEEDAGAEDVAALVPGGEDDLAVVGDVEGLAVHLGVGEREGGGDALGDGMAGADRPDALLLGDVAPEQRAGRAQHLAEDLGVVAGVEDDEAHAVVDAALDAVDQAVVNLVVGAVTPPHQHVRVVQQLVRKTLIRLVQRDRADLQVVGRQLVLQRVVDALRVELTDVGALLVVALLMNILIPDGHLYGHDAQSFLSFFGVVGSWVKYTTLSHTTLPRFNHL